MGCGTLAAASETAWLPGRWETYHRETHGDELAYENHGDESPAYESGRSSALRAAGQTWNAVDAPSGLVHLAALDRDRRLELAASLGVARCPGDRSSAVWAAGQTWNTVDSTPSLMCTPPRAPRLPSKGVRTPRGIRAAQRQCFNAPIIKPAMEGLASSSTCSTVSGSESPVEPEHPFAAIAEAAPQALSDRRCHSASTALFVATTKEETLGADVPSSNVRMSCKQHRSKQRCIWDAMPEPTSSEATLPSNPMTISVSATLVRAPERTAPRQRQGAQPCVSDAMLQPTSEAALPSSLRTTSVSATLVRAPSGGRAPSEAAW